MEELRIANFRFGWDQRRTELTSQPGTLETLENLFVNSGAELEKRLAFVDQNAFPATTFGLEATDTGLLTFGVVAPGAVGTLPTGVTYQRLTHPSGSAGAFLGVVYSSNMNGKAFVIGQYAQGYAAFYDGTYVAAFVNGVLIGASSLSILANDVKRQINLELTDWVCTVESGTAVTSSPIGVHFVPTSEEDSTGGAIGLQEVSQDQAVGGSVPAMASFEITGGGIGGWIELTAPAASDGSGTAALTAGHVAWLTDAATTARQTADAVNTQTALTGYSARADAAVVTVYAPLAWGNFTYNLTVNTSIITTGAGTAVGSLVISPNPVSRTVHSRQGRTQRINVSATVSGGTPSYTWAEVSSGSGNGITCTSSNAQATFSGVVSLNETIVGRFKVTDSTGSPKVYYFEVALTLLPIGQDS